MDMHKKESVLISYILRHGAIKEGIEISNEGWVSIFDLMEFAGRQNYYLTREMIEEIVATDSKQRYELIGCSIRALQGHSINGIKADLTKAIPPIALYHGTSKNNVDSILKNGITKKARTYVHLSKDINTAIDVGARHGKPYVFTIDCKKMVEDKIDFFLAGNGVWLVDFVAPEYLINE